MEFSALARVPARESCLQAYVRIDTLPRLCASITRILSQRGDHGEIYCVWGQFRVHREIINAGVRFSLPGCPNALQWTLTEGRRETSGFVLVHCTVNQSTSLDADFRESLEEFVQHWKQGLERSLVELRVEGTPKPGPVSMPWFG